MFCIVFGVATYELQDLQNKPYDSELHAALVSAQRENAALEKLRRAREEAASLVP